MQNVQKAGIIFFIGALGYGVVEVAFRGYTHWTMLLLGGAVFWLLYGLQGELSEYSLWRRCLVGTAVITSAEFITGCIVNLWLRWNVWDYSELPFELWGQICLLFSFLWFLLCGPIFYIASKIRGRFEA